MCGCGGELKEFWHFCCPACWEILPEGLKQALHAVWKAHVALTKQATLELVDVWEAAATKRRAERKRNMEVGK